MKDLPLTDVDRFILDEAEGKLFTHISLSSIHGKVFLARKDWYTVQNRVIYLVSNGWFYPTWDKALSLKTDCNRVGIYDPDKTYKAVRREYTYQEIKKRLRL